MYHFAFSMKTTMNDQALLERVDSLSQPQNFYDGVLRSSEELPNNLLIFVRKSLNQLSHLSHKPSLHERWVLVVALSGAGTLQLDQHSISIPVGHAVLIPPLRLHGYKNAEPNLRWLFVTFDWPEHAPADHSCTSIQPLCEEAKELLLCFIKTMQYSKVSGTIAAAQLLEVIRLLWSTSSQPVRHRDTLFERIYALCSAQPGISVSDVARQLGISESHLRARFRKEFGISLGRYLRQSRLRRAALWIREEGLSVQLAAERAGYPDAATFSRAFSKNLGYTPSSV
ncbi:AraC family transcriptional regulator [Coraliomargarita sp. SDUM461004]|uniref:AraC family transcriptional regulator n=2 Tax=Thalassobacterium sedimentorum TaxID=3041258 RepID=A0ABU1AG59_9BACT|nr:AraC family transcriptional regulator [Coraliomargarita sp. SDUM461004]